MIDIQEIKIKDNNVILYTSYKEFKYLRNHVRSFGIKVNNGTTNIFIVGYLENSKTLILNPGNIKQYYIKVTYD